MDIRYGPRLGSSPLARGLPPSGRIPNWYSGIIPARAGFTVWEPQVWRAPRDHPRSRGVYPTFNGPTISTTGSSPLARGLRIRIGAPCAQ